MTKRNETTVPLIEKEIFTTGEAAELCNVSQQTIIRCFDKGRLNGFRVPGSRFRRIPRSDLIDFMKNNGMDAQMFSSATPTVLLIEQDRNRIEGVRNAIGHMDAVQLEVAVDAFDAGSSLERYQPDLVIVSSDVGGLNPVTIRRRLDESDRGAARIMVFLGENTNGLEARLMGSGIDTCIKGGVEPSPILDELRGLEGS